MRIARSIVTTVGILALAMAGTPDKVAAAPIEYTLDATTSVDMIVDVRPSSMCDEASLPGAHCLPVRDVLGPHKRLANIGGLLWLLGTVGLKGQEHVLVIGEQANHRDFMAGLLYLAGQKKVSVLDTPLSLLNGQRDKWEPGVARSKTREAVFQAPMRSDAIVLRSELLRMIRSDKTPVLLDGRREVEYWGGMVRAARGGHIPGAQHAALASWTTSVGEPPVYLANAQHPVLYGHDAYEGLALLARVIAKRGKARLYLEGWVGWALDGALPVDVVTYRDKRPAGAMAPELKASRTKTWSFWNSTLASWIAGLACVGAGFLLGYGMKINRKA